MQTHILTYIREDVCPKVVAREVRYTMTMTMTMIYPRIVRERGYTRLTYSRTTLLERGGTQTDRRAVIDRTTLSGRWGTQG